MICQTFRPLTVVLFSGKYSTQKCSNYMYLYIGNKGTRPASSNTNAHCQVQHYTYYRSNNTGMGGRVRHCILYAVRRSTHTRGIARDRSCSPYAVCRSTHTREIAQDHSCLPIMLSIHLVVHIYAYIYIHVYSTRQKKLPMNGPFNGPPVPVHPPFNSRSIFLPFFPRATGRANFHS